MMIIIYTIFSLFSLISIEAIYLSPCAIWNTTGITVLGTNLPGNASNELNFPQGLYLHRLNNHLYVADTDNRRIQMISLNDTSRIATTIVSNLDSISSIYVDDDENSIYISLRYEDRVVKWRKNATMFVQIGDQCKQCGGIWIDTEKNVYMSESGTHTILKWSSKTNITKSIAGRTDEEGHTSDHLYFPTGIYLNSIDNTLYIADTRNNRIQKWMNNSQQGTTIAGSKDGIEGFDSSKLANPLSIWIDDDQSEIVYIADSDNNRIQRWFKNAKNGTTIAGGKGSGNENDQLSTPNSLSFDYLGNLYVCDGKNHRIQKFLLISNETCDHELI